MDWLKKLSDFSSALRYVAVNSTANTFNFLGSVACTAGGIGYAITDAMNVTAGVSYYGAVNGHVNATFGIEISPFGFTEDGSIPIHRQGQIEGGIFYALKDYITPGNVMTVSFLLMSSGTVLRVVGDNIKNWDRNQREIKFFKKQPVEFPRPSWKEHLYVNAGALCSVASQASFGYGCTQMVLQLSGFKGSSYSVTYPTHSPYHLNGSEYQGPVEHSEIPIDGVLYERNFTDTLPIIHTPIDVTEYLNASGTANADYGVGFFVNSHDKSPPHPALPLMLAAGNYYSSFFYQYGVEIEHKRRIKEYKKRVKEYKMQQVEEANSHYGAINSLLPTGS